MSFLISFLLFLSLLSKETGVVFILLALLYNLAKTQKQKKIYAFYKRYNLINLIPITISLFTYIILRISAYNHPMFVYLSNPQITNHTNRLLYVPQIALAFLSEVLTPTRKPIHNNFFQDKLSADFLPFLIISLVTLACYLFWQWLKNKSTLPFTTTLLLFYSWIILGIVLYLQIFPLEFFFAERWLSLTEIGILGVLGVFLSTYQIPKNKWTILCSILFGFLLLLYLGETIHLNFLWQDWQHYLA